MSRQVSLYLLHMHVAASLGNLRLANHNVPEEHPYHWVIQNRATAARKPSLDLEDDEKEEEEGVESGASIGGVDVKSLLAIDYTMYSPGCAHAAPPTCICASRQALRNPKT